MGNGCGKTKNDRIVEYDKSMFNFHRIVGKGGFGRVWKVSNKKTKAVYALKIIDKAKVITKKSVGSIMNERQILANLCAENSCFLVNMKCSFQDRQNLYLLIDYLESGDLRYYINHCYKFSEEQTKFLIRCIMEGLNSLHQKNIIHRDIKPQNLILDKKGYCRITDLGIARAWKMENSNQTSGTPGYMSPEVLMRQNHSFGADYYAVGVIAYELFVGKRPYLGKDRKAIRDQMLGRQAKLPNTCTGISKQGVDFVNRMLQRVTRKRLGHNGISQILNHPWLKLSSHQKQQFINQRINSPIVPLQIIHSHALSQMTEPNQQWRQNILLLKSPETQRLFQDYDFNPESAQEYRRSSTYSKPSSLNDTASTNYQTVLDVSIKQIAR